YPLNFIFSTLKSRLKVLLNSTHYWITNANEEKNSFCTISFLTMLFINDVPEKFKHAVHLYDKLFFTLYNKLIKVRKDPRLKTERSNVVYKFDCKDCDALYVG
ncbi:hypothetical protein EAG_14523, partial [Camponotus floridanus]